MFRGLQVVVSGIALAGFTLAGAAVASAQEVVMVAPVMSLDWDTVVFMILSNTDKTADFESVLAKYNEEFEKNENPVRKTQLAGMKFYKSPTAVQGNAVYV